MLHDLPKSKAWFKSDAATAFEDKENEHDERNNKKHSNTLPAKKIYDSVQ